MTRHKILNKEQLEIEYLKLKVEWLEENQELFMRGKELYTFDGYMQRFYEAPDEEMEDVLIQLFEEHYIEAIYFGHWCIQCGAPISTEGAEYCDPCLIAQDMR